MNKSKPQISEDILEYDENLEVDGGVYNPKAGFDKASIVAEAVRNCFQKRAVEMSAGQKTTILDKEGNAFPKVLPDTRKVFIGAVESLISLLRYEFSINEKYEKKLREFNKCKKDLFEKYAFREKEYIPVFNKEGKHILNSKGFVFDVKETGRKFIPEKDTLLEFYPLTYDKGAGVKTKWRRNYIEHFWDQKIDLYWDEMLKLYDKMFGIINCLISDALENYSSSNTNM